MNSARIVNVSAVPHRSPFRYPGGKTWLVPRVRQWLASLPGRPAEFVEPFAGGGIVGLSVLFESLAERARLVELDPAVGAVWQAIVDGEGPALAERIETFDVTLDNVRAVLEAQPTSLIDRAFVCVVRNRMQRGGIMAPGASLMKSGENGRGLRSRWYAATLARRLRDLHAIRDRLGFTRGDGLTALAEVADRTDVVCLIDPPYTIAGRRLYACGDVDHPALFDATAQLRGDFLMTYDDVPAIRELAIERGFDVERVAMKSGHHAVKSELLIGRDLRWAR